MSGMDEMEWDGGRIGENNQRRIVIKAGMWGCVPKKRVLKKAQI